MMKLAISVICIGVVVITFGIIFYLQGISVVGPTSSFMYSNPKWVDYGQWIAIGGVAILAGGVVLSLRRPR